MTRNHRFTFTNFDLSHTVTFYDNLIVDRVCSYLCYGVETCPTTGTVHHQGYCIFKYAKTLTAAKKHLPAGAHIEVAKGGTASNVKYCSKEGVFHEFGERDAQGSRTDLIEVMDYAVTHGIDSTMRHYPAQWARNYRALDIYVERFHSKPPRNFVTQMIYLWGPSLAGKTRHAVEDGGEIVSYTGQFFIGYKQQDVIIFDDVDSNFNIPRSLLYQLGDRYPLTINIKNGSISFVTKKIYLTSNFPPEKTFPYIDDALRRRMEIREFTL